MTKHYDLFIAGGGAAGMAAANKACELGIENILLVDRNPYLGGVLPQCVHNGFGLGYFHEDMTGVDYCERFREIIADKTIDVLLDTMILKIGADKTALLSSKDGLMTISFDRCVLATGARERTIGSLCVGGTRPAGIFTAGTAQKMVNIAGYNIGENIVILGSGDIGQIMARRLSLKGKKIKAMIEINGTLGGLPRNQKNCIDAFNIPVILNSTIVKIHGDGRICGVTISHIDTGLTEYIECDTLLTSIGLIPEQEIITDLINDGIFPSWLKLCGNCEHIYEIVDSVTFSAEKAVSEMI